MLRSVDDKHAHILAELPIDLTAYRRAIGEAKRAFSMAVANQLPGHIGSRGDKHDMLRDEQHRQNALFYVRNKHGPGAAVWCDDGLRRPALRG